MQPRSDSIGSPHPEDGSPSSSYDIPLKAEKKEIRIAVLLPGQWEDVISCNLSEISLANPDPPDPDETLSYVWEGEPGFAEICVDGQPRQFTMSLFLALRRLRKRHEERTLWIDALCIDQSNNVEKSHQVGLMREIYQRCARVCLWIGDYANGPDCPPNTRTIEDTARLLSSGYDQLAGDKFRDRGFAVFSSIQGTAEGKHFGEIAWCGEEDSANFRFSVLDAFVNFINKPWWDRIWVVQEAVLPPEAIVLYGSIQMPWLMLDKSANCMGMHFTDCCKDWLNIEVVSIWTAFTRFRAETFQFEEVRNGKSIQELLYRFRTRKASIDCDMVYELYGLANDMHIEPDYSLTKFEVYSRIVLHSIQQENNISILEGQRKLQTDVPTWIYDWSSPESPHRWYAEHEQLGLNQFYEASPVSYKLTVTHKGHTLSLSGILVDKVMLVSVYSADQNDLQDWGWFFSDCWRLVHD
jgi:hypothetical protein